MGQVTAAKLAKAENKAKVGKIIMLVGCILLFFNAFFSLLDFTCSILYFFAPPGEFKDFLDFGYSEVWSDPLSIMEYIAKPFISAFYIFAGIGGISWIRDKGPFMSFASRMAVIALFLIIINLFLDIRNLVMSNWNWGNFFLSFIDLQLTCGIYFVGWFLAKGKIDD